MEFSREPFAVLEQNFHLAQQHWHEIMRTQHALDMHWDLYRFVEQVGNLVCFYARHHGEVVGYALFFLQPQLHSKHISSAMNDSVFIGKTNRKGWDGYRFIAYCDCELRALGIQMITWQVTDQADFSPILRRLGYSKFSTLYVKEAGD